MGGCRSSALTGHAHLARHLASWHHDEFGHLYDETVWNEPTAVAEFEAMAGPGCPDITWVAFDGDGRDAEHVLGSVSLVGRRRPHRSSNTSRHGWRACSWRRPRGRGVGTALIDHLLAEALGLGHQYVYLFTSGQERYYLDRGWRTLATVVTGVHHDQNTAVMAKSTSPRGARRAVSSTWCSNPDTDGAYSYLRIGGTPDHRARLAGAVLPQLWIAGEATSVEPPGNDARRLVLR